MANASGESTRPWWQSTFSIVAVILTVGITVLSFVQKDVTTLKEVALLVLGSYGMKKGMEMAKNGGMNGSLPPPSKGGETVAAPPGH